MVLFYGLLALETANNTVAASTTALERKSVSKKQKPLRYSIEPMSSSSNSWIYTQDLRKRFEERYADYRYIFVPIYVDGKNSYPNYSTTTIIPHKSDGENSWMYSKSLRDRLFYSTSKISLPITTNISSSTCCVTNQAFMYDDLPVRRSSKKGFFKRSLSAKEKSTFNRYASSLSSFNTANNLMKYRTNVLVEEDDENAENENYSMPLIKHNSVIPSCATTELSNDENTVNDKTIDGTKLNAKQSTTHTNKLTRLRSFFFKSSSSHSNTKRQQIMLSSSSLRNRIPKT